jgi:hypothetical protein
MYLFAPVLLTVPDIVEDDGKVDVLEFYDQMVGTPAHNDKWPTYRLVFEVMERVLKKTISLELLNDDECLSPLFLADM